MMEDSGGLGRENRCSGPFVVAGCNHRVCLSVSLGVAGGYGAISVAVFLLNSMTLTQVLNTWTQILQ